MKDKRAQLLLKRSFRWSLLLVIFGLSVMVRGEDEKEVKPLKFGQAIDFLDNAFFTKRGDYYSLEELRERVKKAYDAGFRKIYFRDQGGVSYYSSKVRRMYGGSHKPSWASKLLKTIHTYDPVAEYIKICHELGMEFYYWHTVFDTAGLQNFPGTPDYERYGEWPSRDWNIKEEHFIAHRFADRPVESLKMPIGKIEIITENVPVYKDGDFDLYVAKHGEKFTRYEGAFQVKVIPSGKGAVVEITGLKLESPVVKLQGKKETGFRASCHTAQKDCGRAFYIDGTPVDLFTSCEITITGPYGLSNMAELALEGHTYAFSMNFGNNNEALILRFGDFERYAKGIPEYGFKENRDRIKAIITELYQLYPGIDGVAFSIRNHAWPRGGSRPAVNAQGLIYGFSKPVVEEYAKRYGVDITKEDFDLVKLQKLRGEFFTQMLGEVSQIVHDKGGKLECMAPIRHALPFAHGTMYFWLEQTSIDDFFAIDTWAKKGYVDNVIMLGTGPFQKVLNPEMVEEVAAFKKKLEGTKTRLTMHYLVSEALRTPDSCDFLGKLMELDGLDEIEAYEEQGLINYNTYPAFINVLRNSKRPIVK